ncbi:MULTISPECIES: YicC/YloC family endoribonuclease [Clostridium]|uniref:YicC family protein n=1 Tax=Clostridium senegalense TaxID=1465809 RepID=A0A6M0GZD6_9CLOT|nr:MULTISPECIES: YicC/YloC family endoribonuclease [Clostridium]NEU03278.1 YicC family protein [Clostridium senegalense]
MIKSMTGFGRGSVPNGHSNFIVEIKSVNHRYFELNVRMPRALISLEDGIRKILSEKIKRGKVDVFITQKTLEKENVEAVLNEELIKSYMNCLNKVQNMYDLRDDISTMSLVRLPEAITLEQKEENLEEVWKELQASLNIAMDSLLIMRLEEGEKLRQDIEKKCDLVLGYVNEIGERVPGTILEYREKLRKRLKELLEDTQIEENRFAMEVALLADKTAIDEEIVRLNSHICQVKETLKIEGPIGRKLDFIIQEMNRETNTIASKVTDLSITNLALEIKSEIEKIREQAQNIE